MYFNETLPIRKVALSYFKNMNSYCKLLHCALNINNNNSKRLIIAHCKKVMSIYIMHEYATTIFYGKRKQSCSHEYFQYF